jgi:1-acyl-sn-glycerol-3-phosphate acyltransferase
MSDASGTVTGVANEAAWAPRSVLRGASLASRRLLEMTGVLASALTRAATLPTARGARFRAQAASFGVLGADTCAVHGIRRVVSGVVPTETCVMVANHLGYLDPLALASAVPCTAVAKREIDGWPLIGERARELGILFVDRADPMSGAYVLRQALRRLRHGVSILNFPEGSTTRGETLLPLRRGIFGVARLAGVPIVPVRIDLDDPSMAWVGDDSFLPHYARLCARSETTVRVRFGAPLDPASFSDVDALVEATRAFLQRSHHSS